MIKSAFYIAILIWSSIQAFAQQNLIVNGDFEDYSSCPQSESNPFQNPKEIEKCIGWKPPTHGTSDYFNTCSTNPTISIPENFAGKQSPFSGNGYLGGYFTNYTGGAGTDGYSGIMWWEYIQGQLTTSLEQGKVYRFSMEISLAELSDLMITELGAYFSDTPISSVNTAALNVIPQCVFTNTNYFSDTVKWIHLETLYQATGTEQYITIGNFRDNITSDTLRRYSNTPFITSPFKTYFYIDDVQLIDTSWGKPIANIFTPNGDGLNDLWILSYSDKEKSKKVSIMNRWGNLVKEGDLDGFTWDGKTQSGKECSDGTYFYKISNTNIAGFIQLVR